MYQCSKFSELGEIAQRIPLFMPRKTTNNDDDDSSFNVGGYDLYDTHRCDICVDLIIYHGNSLESYMCQCWQLTRQYKWTPPYHTWGILLVNTLSVFWTLTSLTPSESGLEEVNERKKVILVKHGQNLAYACKDTTYNHWEIRKTILQGTLKPMLHGAHIIATDWQKVQMSVFTSIKKKEHCKRTA